MTSCVIIAETQIDTRAQGLKHLVSSNVVTEIESLIKKRIFFKINIVSFLSFQIRVLRKF